MKIGIFGDSFADPFKNNPTKSWIDILAENYDIACFGHRGTSLYFSAKLLEENYSKFDKCVMMVTHPGRIEFPREIEKLLLNEIADCPNMFSRHITSHGQADLKFKNFKELGKSKTANAYKAAMDFYTYLHDEEKESYIHNIIVKYLKDKFPNLILLRISSATNLPNMPISDISIMETNKWGAFKFQPGFGFNECRNCHLTEANNVILGNKIVDMLQGKHVDLKITDFVHPAAEEKDFYIKKI